jgi:hypothetical protein
MLMNDLKVGKQIAHSLRIGRINIRIGRNNH